MAHASLILRVWESLPPPLQHSLLSVGLSPHPTDLEALAAIIQACPTEEGQLCVAKEPILQEVWDKCIQCGGMPDVDILPQINRLLHCCSIFPCWASWNNAQKAAAEVLRQWAPQERDNKRKREDFFWMPRKSRKGHMTQRELDDQEKAKWSDRLSSMLLSWKSHFQFLSTTGGGAAETSPELYRALMGNARAQTIKSHFKALSKTLAWCPDVLPLSDRSITTWLQRLQHRSDASPHKLIKTWRALNFVAEKYGATIPSENSALQSRFEYLADILADTAVKPGKRAKPLGKNALEALEWSARCRERWTDRVAASFFRWMAGASPRYNDTCHTRPASMVSSTETLEFAAWQTKTKKKTSSHKPQPLVAVKVAFWSGGSDKRVAMKPTAKWQPKLEPGTMESSWWAPFEEFTRMRNLEEASVNDDFLLPAPTAGRERFSPKPCGNDQALKWLRTLLAESNMVTATEVQEATLASFRVFLPNLAHALNISKERRQWLGKWAEPSMADTYTRQHRNVVLGIMREIMEKTANDPTLIDKAAGSTVPADLANNYWSTGNPQEEPAPRPSIPDVTSEVELPVIQKQEKRPHTEITAEEGGPLWLGYNNTKTGSPPRHKLHVFDVEGVAVGCKWSPGRSRVQLFYEADWDPAVYKCCHFCWLEFERPDEEDNSGSDNPQEVDTDSDDDADSEVEAFASQLLEDPIPLLN